MFRRIRKTGTYVSKRLRGQKPDAPLKVDDTDRKILRAITADSRLSLRNLAAATHISVGTIRERLSRLQAHGVIKNYTVTLDPSKLGYKMTGVIQVFLSSKDGIREIEGKVAKAPYVDAVYSVTGGSDVIIIARFRDSEDLNRFVKEVLAMKGILRTSTLVVLDTFKEDFRTIV